MGTIIYPPEGHQSGQNNNMKSLDEATGAKELKEENEHLKQMLEQSRARERVLMEALEFYADEANYKYPIIGMDQVVDRYAGTQTSNDGGKTARSSIEKVKKMHDHTKETK